MFGLDAGREVADLHARIQTPIPICLKVREPVVTFNVPGDALVQCETTALAMVCDRLKLGGNSLNFTITSMRSKVMIRISQHQLPSTPLPMN